MNKIRNFLLALLGALFATTSQAAMILLQNNSNDIAVGDDFVVDVILRDAFAGEFSGDTLLAFGFNLSFDDSALSLVSSTVGTGWDDDSPFIDADVAGSTFPGIDEDGSSVDILLARLSFNALSAGNFTLGIGGSPLVSPNLGLIYLGGETEILAQSLIAVVQPVPLPATAWLLASGLIMMLRARRLSAGNCS
jgi:hypothetical protein